MTKHDMIDPLFSNATSVQVCHFSIFLFYIKHPSPL